MELEAVQQRGIDRWVVAATGPSLTEQVAEACRHEHVLAVNDAYRRFPNADVLYACDGAWIELHSGCPGFMGEKWTTHNRRGNDKEKLVAKYPEWHVLKGDHGDIFSSDPRLILYGNCSGFQAINLALLFGAREVVLVGFDMQAPRGTKRHFFGDHPAGLKNSCKYQAFIPAFNEAARKYKGQAKIINCTPGSALMCWPQRALASVIRQTAEPEPSELGYA